MNAFAMQGSGGIGGLGGALDARCTGCGGGSPRRVTRGRCSAARTAWARRSQHPFVPKSPPQPSSPLRFRLGPGMAASAFEIFAPRIASLIGRPRRADLFASGLFGVSEFPFGGLKHLLVRRGRADHVDARPALDRRAAIRVPLEGTLGKPLIANIVGLKIAF